jgi:hypothetical protein
MHFLANPQAEIAERRRVEDGLLQLGELHSQIENTVNLNRTAIRSWIEPARRAGLTVRDIGRLTGFSTQTLHAWMRETMTLIPWAHMGLGDPAPTSLEEAVVRTIAERPDHSWGPAEVGRAIPSGWLTGTGHEIHMALDLLARSGQIWRTEDGFRIADPTPTARPD